MFDPESSPEDTENKLEETSAPGEEKEELSGISIKKELDKIVRQFNKMEKRLPDLVQQLVMRKKLNIMILDLYDYDKGYEVSFFKYDNNEEDYHGKFSYGVPLLEYIMDGEIPYELYDCICNYEYKIFYDGYVVCKVRIQFGQEYNQQSDFGQEDNQQSHFVLLQHSIQSIDAECLMNCKNDESLIFDAERARLVAYYSPELCLDPDPIVADIIISNELNQHPFITPYLKGIIKNEKCRREKGVYYKSVNGSEPPVRSRKVDEEENWSFRLENSKPEEIRLAKMETGLLKNFTLEGFLKTRLIYFPCKESLSGSHVEIENFVYEYQRCTRKKTVEKVTDKLCIGVLGQTEYYYGAYQLDIRMKDLVPLDWWKIGGRDELDKKIKEITRKERKLSCGGMTITHNRFFDKEGKKLEDPVSEVVAYLPSVSSEDRNEPMEEV